MAERLTSRGSPAEEVTAPPPGARGWCPTAGSRCRQAVRGCARWIIKRQRIAVGQFLRGVCYGVGAAAASLLAVWVRTR